MIVISYKQNSSIINENDYFKQEIVVPGTPEETKKLVEQSKESTYPWQKTNNVEEVYIKIFQQI